MKSPRSVTSDLERLPKAGDTSVLVEIANRQELRPVDEARLSEAVHAVFVGENVQRANVSLVFVDDAAIHELNRRFLNHDEPTDVLSFVLEQGTGFVEGEIIVSVETAQQAAQRFGWNADDELLLYVIHGALHLVGYDDQSAADQTAMRERERLYLQPFGLNPRYEES
jgi:probable rRNA maturation factor